ncbi:MAG: T9SS type B sorting domain-containing protein [Flavobacterium sp.]
MKNAYLFIIISFCFHINSFGQDFQWVRQIKGIEDYSEYASFIEADNNGNTYTLGKSNSIAYDIDPTQNGVQLINNQNAVVPNPEDIYLIKLTEDGDFVWGKALSVLKDDETVHGLKFDSQGNIYVLAFITELYQNQSLIYGYGSLNIIKIDPNGNEIYRRKFQNTGNINSGQILRNSSFDLDSSDNIYLTGMFQNTVILDNNPQNNLVTNGSSTYVIKLNQNGEILWSKNLNYSLSGGISLETDSNDKINILITSFNTNGNGHSLNILKLNNVNGNPIWLKAIENAIFSDFRLDSANYFTIIGLVSNDIFADLNPDPGISNIIQNKSFILFLDSNGNYYDSRLFDLDVKFNTIEVDAFNNYHLGGKFENINTDFDPSSNNFHMSSVGYYEDGFYLKLNESRNFVQAFRIGTAAPSANEDCYSAHINSIKIINENLYIAGEFAGDGCDLDPSLTSSYLLNSFIDSGVNLDGFMLKLGNCDTLAPSAPSTQNFCSLSSPRISNLTPSSSIKWYDSATSTIQLSTATPLVNGQIYYASRQIGSCPESQRLAITVTINPTPTPPISINQSFCDSENATISSLIVTGQNIKWYSTLTDTNILSSNTVLQNNTNYFVSQTINGCESNRALINVTINSVALPTLSSPQTFCIQQNSTLNSIAVTGQNIKWYDSATDGNLLPNTTVLVNGQTYYASQTINNCKSLRVPVLINIQNTPAPTGNGTQTFCSAQNPTVSNIVVTGTNLNWYNSGTTINAIPNTTLLINGTTYYVSQTINNCESINRIAVTVNLINTLNANDYSEVICDGLNDGSESINLTSYQSNLISNSSNCTFEYYYSLSGAANQTNSELIVSVTNYNLTTGLHILYVRIISINGCYQIVKLNLSLVNKPIISIPDIVSICERNNVTIDTGLGFDSYTWSTGSTSHAVTISQPGNYSVTVTQNHGTVVCSATKNFTVALSNVATITNIVIQDWTDVDNTNIVYTTGFGDYEYSIDGIHYQASNIFYGLNSGAYTVHVRDKNGCGITKDDIYLLMYPKFFTPNGDIYNDTWAIKFSYFEPGLKVNIFDRYGKLLKTLNNNTSWDGKYNGNELPSSDYWFVVTRENGKEYRGHFTLKR